MINFPSAGINISVEGDVVSLGSWKKKEFLPPPPPEEKSQAMMLETLDRTGIFIWHIWLSFVICRKGSRCIVSVHYSFLYSYAGQEGRSPALMD